MSGRRDYLDAGALLSGSGRYRTLLWRTVNETAPPLGFCMLNPSTADAREDDPTIRRCLSFAEREGAGGIVVINLSPYRAADPADLFAAERTGIDVLCRSENDAQIDLLSDRVGRVVAAWGSTFRRPAWIRALADETAARLLARLPMFCLGRTKHGSPRHPLMVRRGAPLVAYP